MIKQSMSVNQSINKGSFARKKKIFLLIFIQTRCRNYRNNNSINSMFRSLRNPDAHIKFDAERLTVCHEY